MKKFVKTHITFNEENNFDKQKTCISQILNNNYFIFNTYNNIVKHNLIIIIN